MAGKSSRRREVRQLREALGHRHRQRYFGDMVMPIDSGEPDPAFVMQGADRLHRIVTSGDLRFGKDKSVTVIALFTIRRASGLFDFFVIHKVFLPDDKVSRTVQSKLGLAAGQIDSHLALARDTFGATITTATGVQVPWNELDLSQVTDHDEQVRRIRQWGGIGVRRP